MQLLILAFHGCNCPWRSFLDLMPVKFLVWNLQFYGLSKFHFTSTIDNVFVSGIARLCCDARRQVRGQALTYLQRALLVHDLQTLSAVEWEACFNKVPTYKLLILYCKLLNRHFGTQ